MSYFRLFVLKYLYMERTEKAYSCPMEGMLCWKKQKLS